MNEEQIRRIVQEELAKNLNAGDPKIAPHQHDGVDSLTIPLGNIGTVLNFKATPAGKDTFGQDLYGGNNVVPIPIIQGYGVGVASQFNEGDAPDGTMFMFFSGVVKRLHIAYSGEWYYVDLTEL